MYIRYGIAMSCSDVVQRRLWLDHVAPGRYLCWQAHHQGMIKVFLAGLS
jgi:hypothetical protein